MHLADPSWPRRDEAGETGAGHNGRPRAGNARWQSHIDEERFVVRLMQSVMFHQYREESKYTMEPWRKRVAKETDMPSN